MIGGVLARVLDAGKDLALRVTSRARAAGHRAVTARVKAIARAAGRMSRRSA